MKRPREQEEKTIVNTIINTTNQVYSYFFQSPKPSTNTLPDLFSFVPVEVVNYIFQFAPDELLPMRATSKYFSWAWENFTKPQFITSPALQTIKMEKRYDLLVGKQDTEVQYLLKNENAILEVHPGSHPMLETLGALLGNPSNRSVLNAAFEKLKVLQGNNTLIAFQIKEKSLNIINECIIRNRIKPNTHVLTCNDCHLTRFPNLFSDPTLASFWPQLRELYINNNQITELPDVIGQLTALEIFEVSDNRLFALPNTMGKCLNLKKLVVKGNFITALPILAKGVRTINNVLLRL